MWAGLHYSHFNWVIYVKGGEREREEKNGFIVQYHTHTFTHILVFILDDFIMCNVWNCVGAQIYVCLHCTLISTPQQKCIANFISLNIFFFQKFVFLFFIFPIFLFFFPPTLFVFRAYLPFYFHLYLANCKFMYI